MGYFRELPDLEYQSFLKDKNSSLDYIKTKNIFRRSKLRDDLQNVFTLFNKYQIPDGWRPDNVAEDYYGSDELDWVVITTSNIINIRDEWPLPNNQLWNYVDNKYGTKINDTKYYVTKEIKDLDGHLILPAGKRVDSDFSITYWDRDHYTTKSGSNVKKGVSYWQHEVDLNDEKRNIYLLKPEYLQQFLNDFRDIMVYGRSSQYVDDNTIKTENTNITMP